MSPFYLLIPAFFILLFLAPVILQARVSFNLQYRSGVICLYAFGIKLLYYLYRIEGKTIILHNQKHTKTKSLSLANNDLLFLKILTKQIKNKTRLKQLFVFYTLGAGDAFASAVLGGLLNIAVLNFFTTIKSRRPTASLGIYDTINYNKTLFEVSTKGKISISLIDIAYSLLNSVILTWRTKVREKRNML